MLQECVCCFGQGPYNIKPVNLRSQPVSHGTGAASMSCNACVERIHQGLDNEGTQLAGDWHQPKQASIASTSAHIKGGQQQSWVIEFCQ